MDRIFYVDIPVQEIRDAFVEHLERGYGYVDGFATAYRYVVVDMEARHVTSAATEGYPCEGLCQKKSIEEALETIKKYHQQLLCGKIGEHNVIKVKDGITVGCQFISNDQIREIAEKTIGLNKEDEYVLMAPNTVIQKGDQVAYFHESNDSPIVWDPIPDKNIGNIFSFRYNSEMFILRRKRKITDAHTI